MTEFCEKWFFAKKQPLKPVSKEDARVRHSQGLNYCAVIGGFESPTNLISLAGEWVSVHFFDTLGRAYLNYDFKKNDGRLFLTLAVFREYEAESTAILRSVTFSFSIDGSVVMSVDNQNEVNEIETKASIEPNWSDYPAFGEYGSLCDENRVGTS
tara:strand:+ start:533 stop:997 length:465 start_codon:yes stop_codon:yes gene_type:complete